MRSYTKQQRSLNDMSVQYKLNKELAQMLKGGVIMDAVSYTHLENVTAKRNRSAHILRKRFIW